MKKIVYDFEKKYEVQDELLNSGALEGLDKRTLHETVKAMLINTTKDCIKYENGMDPDMDKIMNIIAKKDKTEDDLRLIKLAQDRLRISLHFAQLSENSLGTLIYQMLTTSDIKDAFKQDIPEMHCNLYAMLDLEDELADNLTVEISESYEELSYKQLCGMINEAIEDMIDNVEEYIEDIEKHEYYDDFTDLREIWRDNKKEKANE